MGLFKSKAEKAMQQRILIKRTIGNMNKYVAALEPKKEALLEKARTARVKGDSAQYNLAKSGLKSIMEQQKKVESMILNFEITVQLKDLTSLTGEFLKGMTTMSKEMAKVAESTDFAKAAKEFEHAMLRVEENTEKMDAFLETTDSSFESFSSVPGGVTDKELDALIDSQIADGENNANLEIEAKLKALDKEIKAED